MDWNEKFMWPMQLSASYNSLVKQHADNNEERFIRPGNYKTQAFLIVIAQFFVIILYMAIEIFSYSENIAAVAIPLYQCILNVTVTIEN